MSDVRSNSSEELDEDVLPRGVPNLSGTIVDGRYQIGSILGAGGMGAVFEAQHLRLGRRVALKVLKPTLMHRDDYVERFRREAKTASNIRHPNVVEIIDYGNMADGTVYTVMELLIGEDLSSRLKRVGRMPWPLARWVLVQVVRALHAAHSQGVIHRDIKPANCFLIGGVEGQELVKVLDFGIAKLDQLEAGERALTGTSEILGTPSYMAPEMARGIAADARSEVYSVGVLAYRMLGGQVPFDGNNAFDVLLQHATQAPPPLQSKAPDLPPKVVELVHHLLQKDPGARPQNMQDVEQLMVSLDDQGLPCAPNPQAVVPVHPSSSSSAPIPRGVGSGIHPTPSGSIPAPPTPPPMRRDPAAAGLTMPPPGGSAPSRPLGPPPKPPPSLGRPPSPPARPPGPAQARGKAPSQSSPQSGGSGGAGAPGGLGAAKTMFAPAPASRPGRAPPPAFSKPAAPKLGRPGAPKGTASKPSPGPRRAAPPEPEDRTMLAPSPAARSTGSQAPPASPVEEVDRTMIQPSGMPTLPPSTAAPYPDAGIDRTMMVDAPFARPKPASAAAPAPTPAPSYPGSGVDRTMMVDAPFARPKPASAAAPAPAPSYPGSGVDRTMMVDTPLVRPPEPEPGVDRTMIHPPAGEDLAERTMIHPPSAAMGGGDEDEHRPKRTLMLDDQFAGADRTMILDSGSNDALELDASDVVQVSDGGTQVVDINEVTKAAALAAVGIAAPPAGPHGFANTPAYDPNQPQGPGGQPQGPGGMLQSAAVEVYDDEPEKIGGGRWVMLALIGALVAIGAGGFVAYLLFASDDTETTANADDATPAEDGGEAGDDGKGTPAAADDGGETPPEAGGSSSADGGAEPAADDAAADDDGAADDAAVADDDGGADDGADDGAAADDGAEPDPKPPKPKPDPKTTEPSKPRGPPSDGTVKKRVAKAAAKKCSPTKSYKVSFIIGPGGELKLPSVSPRDSTGDCILGIVRKAKFRTRSSNSREQITVSR